MNSDEQLEPTTPYPPRYWWLKRIIVVSMLLAAIFLSAMFAWRWKMDRRLHASIEAIRSCGEPILVEDFVTAPVADTDNAALSLKSAAAAMTAGLTPTELDLVGRFAFGVTLSEADLKTLNGLPASSSATRALARTARFQPEIDWQLTFASPLMMTFLPDLQPQRNLGVMLNACAHQQHRAGHDAEAIEICRDMLSQSDALQHYAPFLVNHLVAVHLSILASNTARHIAFDMTILPGAAATTNPTSPASREQVAGLIHQLLDEKQFRAGIVRSMIGERMSQLETATQPAGLAAIGVGQPKKLELLLRPMLQADVIWMMRLMSQASDAMKLPNLPAAQAAMPDVDAYFRNHAAITVFSRMVSSMLFPAMNRIPETHFRALADRRAAALTLAIRLYQLDHDGRRPAALAELVPTYLPSLPPDPFAADGRTFGYRNDDQNLILYSVGANGTDESGDTSIGFVPHPRRPRPGDPPAGHPSDKFQWDRVDAIYPLLKPADIAPATSAE